jgi:FkbM family methyltransferase
MLQRFASTPRRDLPELVGELKRRAWNLGRFTVERHLMRRRFIERRIYDYRLLLDGDDPGICRQLIRLGRREAEQRFIVHNTLRPGMRVLDLGANVGYYTVMMARLAGPLGHVYAVEPHPANFRLLEANVALNGIKGRTTLQHVAIGTRDGVQPLWATDHSNWHSFHKPEIDLKLEWLRKYQRKVVGHIDVETRTLDSYLADKPPIDYLRMDLEGYEIEILRNLPANRPHVLFETHPEFYARGGEDMRAVLEDLCLRRGFQIHLLVSDFDAGTPEYPDIEPARAVFERKGYGDENVVARFRSRSVYSNLRQDDAIDLICRAEQVNAALLGPAD